MGNTSSSTTPAEKDRGVYVTRLPVKAKPMTIAANGLRTRRRKGTNTLLYSPMSAGKTVFREYIPRFDKLGGKQRVGKGERERRKQKTDNRRKMKRKEDDCKRRKGGERERKMEG